MPKTYIYITTLTLALTSGDLLAEGFYQQVMKQTNAPPAQSINSDTEFSYTPLYLQVVGDGRRPIDLRNMITNQKTCFSYTPLYNKVTGRGS